MHLFPCFPRLFTYQAYTTPESGVPFPSFYNVSFKIQLGSLFSIKLSLTLTLYIWSTTHKLAQIGHMRRAGGGGLSLATGGVI